MGQMTGMNIEQVRALAKTLETKAEQITTTIQEVTSQLQSTEWNGTDRTTFENDWQSNGQTQLKNVSELLRTAGQAADRNATEQENASAK